MGYATAPKTIVPLGTEAEEKGSTASFVSVGSRQSDSQGTNKLAAIPQIAGACVVRYDSDLFHPSTDEGHSVHPEHHHAVGNGRSCRVEVTPACRVPPNRPYGLCL